MISTIHTYSSSYLGYSSWPKEVSVGVQGAQKLKQTSKRPFSLYPLIGISGSYLLHHIPTLHQTSGQGVRSSVNVGEMRPSSEYMSLATTLLDSLGGGNDGQLTRLRYVAQLIASLRYGSTTATSPLWPDVDFCSTPRG